MNDVIFVSHSSVFMNKDTLIEIFNFWSFIFHILGICVLKSSLSAILILSSFSNQQFLITVSSQTKPFSFARVMKWCFLEYISESQLKMVVFIFSSCNVSSCSTKLCVIAVLHLFESLGPTVF